MEKSDAKTACFHLMILQIIKLPFVLSFLHFKYVARVYETFLSTPANKKKKALRLEAYLGMVFGFIAMIYAAVVSDVTLSLVTTMIACFLTYLWTWCIAHLPPNATKSTLLTVQRVAIAQMLLYQALVVGFGPVMNHLYIAQAINILVGTISSNAGAFTLGLSSLYFYKLVGDYVLTVEGGAFWWLVGWGIITSVLSFG